ncbi:hypothetical protein [Micromonospora sp. NPDC050276]|uniref:hypothetical protein n=1 Tax=Micromonospora sp. NPDC050276 TaxID=3364278 RepID=UPI0037920190
MWAFLAAVVLAAAVALWRHRWVALPGAVLVVGAGVSFLDNHIDWPPWRAHDARPGGRGVSLWWAAHRPARDTAP